MNRESWDSTKAKGPISKYLDAALNGIHDKVGPVDQRTIVSGALSILETGDTSKTVSLFESRLKILGDENDPNSLAGQLKSRNIPYLTRELANRIINEVSEYREVYKDDMLNETKKPVKLFGVVTTSTEKPKVTEEKPKEPDPSIIATKEDDLLFEENEIDIEKNKKTKVKTEEEIIPEVEVPLIDIPLVDTSTYNSEENTINTASLENETTKESVIEKYKDEIIKLEDEKLSSEVNLLIKDFSEKIKLGNGGKKKLDLLNSFSKNPIGTIRMYLSNEKNSMEGKISSTTKKIDLDIYNRGLEEIKKQLNVIDRAIKTDNLNNELFKIHGGSTITLSRNGKDIIYKVIRVENGKVYYKDDTSGKEGDTSITDIIKVLSTPGAKFKIEEDFPRNYNSKNFTVDNRSFAELAKEERYKTILEIGNLLKKMRIEGKTIKFIYHGYTYEDEETGELKVKSDLDLDTQGALLMLKLAGIKVDLVEETHKGGRIEPKKGEIHFYLDTGGKPLSIEYEGGGIQIYNDHHQPYDHPDKSDKNSATQQQYEILFKNGLLKREPWLDSFTNFVTQEDNLTYADDPRFTYQYFKNNFAKSIFGLNKEVPFEKKVEWFGKGKNPFDPQFTPEELKEEIETTVVGYGPDGKKVYKKKKLPLEKIIERVQKKVESDLRDAFPFAIKMMKINGIKDYTKNLGKVFYNNPDNYREYKDNNGVIKKKANKLNYPFLTAKVNEYDTYISYQSETTLKYFINNTTHNLEPTFEDISEIAPETVIVNSAMIIPPKKKVDREVFYEKSFLETLDLVKPGGEMDKVKSKEMLAFDSIYQDYLNLEKQLTSNT